MAITEISCVLKGARDRSVSTAGKFIIRFTISHLICMWTGNRIVQIKKKKFHPRCHLKLSVYHILSDRLIVFSERTSQIHTAMWCLCHKAFRSSNTYFQQNKMCNLKSEMRWIFSTVHTLNCTRPRTTDRPIDRSTRLMQLNNSKSNFLYFCFDQDCKWMGESECYRK